MSDDKVSPNLNDEDVRWFVEQIRVMFPDSERVASVWQDLLTKGPKEVLREIVGNP